MGKRRQTATLRRRRTTASAPPNATRGFLLLAVGVIVLLAVAGAGWWMTRRAEQASQAPTQSSGVIGGVTGCRGMPRFATRLGYADRLGISTSERLYHGLVIC